ncbi:ATG19 (YOL082W) [Zygosaccharomyces parabailii]|nr:ATG19 (YOL082W) [Zygosaccharomyces parabailii]CDH12664.1 uncharacterized protein ZBAI_04450 [Zygosaccharomyces bailii ISA1307]
MSQGFRNAGVVYGTRGEIFDATQGQSLEDFISNTFDIPNVFEDKLVMGRCICHGKKDLETDVLLSSQDDTKKFLFSRESTKPHIILIYDKPGTLNSKPETQSDILVSAQQWEELVESVKKLQTSVGAQSCAEYKSATIHDNVICDGCYPSEELDAKSIVGPRFKCLDCANFDLCTSCEAKGFEKGAHKSSHNMAKINTPLKKCFGKCYNTTGLASKAINGEKTIIADIPHEQQEDVIKMFSNADKLREVISGYQVYCSSKKPKSRPLRASKLGRERHRRELSLLEIFVTRRDNLLTFTVHNVGKCTVPAGSVLRLSLFHDEKLPSTFSIEGCLGPHELAPGGRRVLNQQISSSFPRNLASNEPRIFLFDGTNSEHVLYAGSASTLFDSTFQLRPPEFANSSQHDCKPLSPLIKEDVEVVSSSNTNDEYSLCSELSNDSNESNISNWEDYDFLSEDDI